MIFLSVIEPTEETEHTCPVLCAEREVKRKAKVLRETHCAQRNMRQAGWIVTTRIGATLRTSVS